MIDNSKETVFTASADLSAFQKVSAVIMGAFLMGALWRFRGEHGYGSSWGLLTVGICYLLLVFAIFGYRRKANFLLFSLSAVSFMLTTPGWGTLNSQITGVLFSGVDDGTGMMKVFINPFSGVFIMLCLGFGLAAIFAFMLGQFFSDRSYVFKDYLIILIVFFGVEFLSRATVSHLILDWVQPQAGDLFRQGLQKSSFEGTPWQVYLQHFFDIKWAELIHGGRNYFTSVETIAAALSALAVWFTVRFGFKDKVAGRLILGICLAFAFAITFADLSLFFSNGGYRMEHKYDLLLKLSGWGMWEYFTGFFAGGLLMLIFVNQPFKRLVESAGIEDSLTAKMPKTLYGVLNFLSTFVLIFSVSLIRPFISRYDDSEAYITILITVSVLFLFAVIAVAIRKGVQLERIDFKRFCVFALPAFFAANVMIYLFAGTVNMQNYRNTGDMANKLVLASVIVFTVTYPILFKNGETRIIKRNNNK